MKIKIGIVGTNKISHKFCEAAIQNPQTELFAVYSRAQQKVMAINEQEAETMIACAKKNHVILLEAMRSDFDPAFELVKEQLPRIGTLRRVEFEFCQYSSRYDNFLNGIVENAFDPELLNSAARDIGVYCIHAIVRLFGEPEKVEI